MVGFYHGRNFIINGSRSGNDSAFLLHGHCVRIKIISRLMSMKSGASATALRRLMTEYKELMVNPPEGITAGPISEDNFFEWEALIP